ncbi:hypothetical protein L7F22_011453 [Adiantum nelumboides]|nr:hypothetical protein [Adiantum nelumboides]
MKKLMCLSMKEGSSVSSHMNEFNALYSQLTSKGLNFDDEMKAIFLLCSLPASWDTFNTAISNSTHGGKLAFGDVTSVLLTEEIRHQSLDSGGHDNEMQEVVGLMKNLSVHMMGGGRSQGYGYERGYGSNESFAGGRGRGMAGRGDMFQCYNCGEWGHKSPQCDKPKRMGGDMFPLPSQIPSRAQDYGIEIKGEAGPSGLTAEEKGKTKVVNIIRLDKGKDDINAMVMSMRKRTTREQETSDAGPSHKRGKQAETGTGKEKKKRKPRRHYNTSDFPLGEGQPNYNLRADLVGRKADVTFGQLMEMCPRLKRQWKRMVNPMKNEPTKGYVRVLSLNELPDICPTIDAWHKRKCIGEAYIDGGAQVCVITQACVTKLGLHMIKNSGFRIKLANQSRVRCLGIIKNLEVEVFYVKALVNCHVMPAGIGAFPLILGRPWLQATKAVQDWGHGTITLYNRSGDKKKFDMATKQSLDADFDEDDDDEEYSSSKEDDGEESSELNGSSDDSDVEVSSLFLEEEKGQKQATLCLMENEDTLGPYEKIEGLMQPRVQPNVKDELIQKMLSPNLTSHKKGVYLHMLQQFPNLFITSYEEIRGFKGEEINIPIKKGAQPVHQKLRRMGQVQLNALKEEVDKLREHCTQMLSATHNLYLDCINDAHTSL